MIRHIVGVFVCSLSAVWYLQQSQLKSYLSRFGFQLWFTTDFYTEIYSHVWISSVCITLCVVHEVVTIFSPSLRQPCHLKCTHHARQTLHHSDFSRCQCPLQAQFSSEHNADSQWRGKTGVEFKIEELFGIGRESKSIFVKSASYRRAICFPKHICWSEIAEIWILEYFRGLSIYNKHSVRREG